MKGSFFAIDPVFFNDLSNFGVEGTTCHWIPACAGMTMQRVVVTFSFSIKTEGVWKLNLREQQDLDS